VTDEAAGAQTRNVAPSPVRFAPSGMSRGMATPRLSRTRRT
jgi:hypothetical protein